MKKITRWRTSALLAAFASTLTASFGGETVIEATSAGLSLDSTVPACVGARIATLDARSGDLREVGIVKFRSDEPRGEWIIVR